MTIPPLGNLPEMKVFLDKTIEAERRLPESQHLNPAIYNDLVYTYNESWRELGKALASIDYRLDKAEEEIENIKSEILLDRYPAFIEGKPKSFDNMDIRKAFIQKQEDYKRAVEYRDQIKAISALLETRMKSMERACSSLNKKMDQLTRSGRGGPVGSTL
jgi:hypothetical protein